MRIAVVHDWLVTYAGAERALEQILLLYPHADIYSLIEFLPDRLRGFILDKPVRTSFMQHIPFVQTRYRSMLPIMPAAIEGFDLSGYDLIISSSHAVAKGVRTRPGQKHICYCYTPIRYAWDLREQYLTEAGLDRGLKRIVAQAILDRIRRWDLATSDRVSHYVAISHYIADRIKRSYNRDAAVIYPPVDMGYFTPDGRREDFYLTASRMVPYKKIDLIVQAFSMMPERELIVIGEGPDFGKIASRAPRNVRMMGYQSNDVLRDHLRRARAFVFAAEEDFGILPVEAQACCTPVIAYGQGGVAETVIDGQTGLFFRNQTVEDIVSTVERFEQTTENYRTDAIRQSAERFGIERFQDGFKGFVEAVMAGD